MWAAFRGDEALLRFLLERGADLSLFQSDAEDQYETADFPLEELDLSPTTLAALSTAGYDTFLQIIDLERRDFLGIQGLGEEDADRLLQLIDELTVVEGESAPAGVEEDEGDEGSEEEPEAQPVEAAASLEGASEESEEDEPEQ